MANTAVYLPFYLIVAVVFTSISFFMCGLANTSGNFIYQVIVVFCILLAANGFSICISGFAPDAITANGIGIAILVRDTSLAIISSNSLADVLLCTYNFHTL
jgi:ABC-type multidrug transport system permease subunit